MAGLLRRASATKASRDIVLGDYEQGQQVSVAFWRDVWDYQPGPPYDDLLDEIRRRVGATTNDPRLDHA